MIRDERQEEVIVVLHHWLTVEIAVPFKRRCGIVHVGKQQGDVTTRLLRQPFVEPDAFAQQLFNRLYVTCRRPRCRRLYGPRYR